ncbi:PREDICTED: uncharacterized protein LOC106819659, partial [Priapulus caudatus]|uniref:Uncharacterized protein LOC106819659 n=1 Tax=Priapulus caudatus TaxID=37621 RepID=A0ABM1F5M3_PRICU
ALLRRGFRSLWDGFMFNVIIKKRGRIPASDSFVARRVAGPGLASNYYYQVKPEQVLAAFEARMELDELHAYKEEVERVIARPQKDYSNFVNTLFRPFSAGLVKEGVYKDLEKQAKELVAAVKEKIEKRKMELSIGLNPTIKGRVKLLSADLKVAIKVASVMLETFYPIHVIHRQPGSEEEFWEHKNFDFRNWKGLASLILCEIFSTSFLTPLEDTDTTFRLEVQHLNLARYITMLRTADITDDLDTVETVNTAKGKIQIDMPFLDVTVFDPGYRSGDNKSKQVKLSETTATPDRLTPDASSVSDSEGGATGEEEEPVRSVVVNMAHIASAEDIVVSEDGTYGTTV